MDTKILYLSNDDVELQKKKNSLFKQILMSNNTIYILMSQVFICILANALQLL